MLGFSSIKYKLLLKLEVICLRYHIRLLIRANFFICSVPVTLFDRSTYKQVSTCGFPPLENREVSLKQLMGLDFFGGGIMSAEDTVISQTPIFILGLLHTCSLKCITLVYP